MPQPQQNLDLLTFRVGPFRFCVNAVQAEAIIETPKITPVPLTPPSIAGVFSHRGTITVVVSLRRKFGLGDPDDIASGQLILSRLDNELKGFWVDEVLELVQNSDLKSQKLPFFRKNNTFDDVVVKDKHIFFHTDFEKLFTLNDSREIRSFFSSMSKIQPIGSDDSKQSQIRTSYLKAISSPKTRRKADEASDGASERSEAQKNRPLEDQENNQSANTEIKATLKKTISNTETAVNRRKNSAKFSEPNATLSRSEPARTYKPEQRVKADLSSGHYKGKDRKAAGVGSSHDLYSRQQVDEPHTLKSFWGKTLAAVSVMLATFAILAVWWWPKDNPVRHENKLEAVSSSNMQFLSENTIMEKSEGIVEITPTKSLAQPDREDLTQDNTAIAASDSNKAKNHESEKGSETITASSASDSDENEGTLEASHSSGKTGEEVLRIETGDFMLTIERPKIPQNIQPPPVVASEVIEEKFVHIVARGDTLWDIADNYLGNPFRYPELAKLSHIKDSHWIYPGDIITIIRKKVPGKLDG